MLYAALLVQAVATPLPPPRPVTVAEKKAIRAVVDRGLKDPASAQFKWLPVRGAGIYCGLVNAKNAFGGFVGYHPFAVFWDSKSGGLLKPLPQAIVTSENDAALLGVISKNCAEHGYDVE